jgi:hypothetical protein
MLYVAYHAGYIFFCFLWSPTKTVYPQLFFLFSCHSSSGDPSSGDTCKHHHPMVTGFLKGKLGLDGKSSERNNKPRQSSLIKVQCLLMSLSLQSRGTHAKLCQDPVGCFVRICQENKLAAQQVASCRKLQMWQTKVFTLVRRLYCR